MACYKLTSCDAAGSQVIYTTDALTPSIGIYLGPPGTVTLAAPFGECFTVELVEEAHCPCVDPIIPIPVSPIDSCVCTTTYLCYTLTSCVDPGFTVDVITNLNTYVGQLIEVYEYPGVCFTVTGNVNPLACVGVIEEVSCPVVCDCASSLHCYELTNCEAPFAVINVSYFGIIPLNDVIQVLPVQPGSSICWTVTDDNFTPCQPGLPIITSIVNLQDCPTCLGTPPCYSLTSCDGQTVRYSQSDLSSIVNTTVVTSEFPLDGCVFVALSQICNAPDPIDPVQATPCTCVCYTLTDCSDTIVPFNTFVDLSLYVGQTIHLDEYGACLGSCFEVSITVGPCSSPQFPITVTLLCPDPCLPCDTVCYDVVDCETQVVFATLTSPTANGVDLSLYVGQVIGKICDNPNANCTEGCWEIKPGTDNCAQQLSKYVYNIYDNCQECLNSCFGLLNCETLVVDYNIKYTIPNPNALPNPNTLLNTVLGSLCFTVPEGGCVTGCYQVVPAQDCTTSIDWSDVVSYTGYPNCSACLPKCYLLTECGVATPTVILADNDLSLYVGTIVKYNGLCYGVTLAQDCIGAITINNLTASFQTCEECNYCDCPQGYTKIDNICQQISTVPATLFPTIYTSAPGTVSPNHGSSGTNFYANITANPSPIVENGGNQFEDAAATPIASVNNVVGVWGGPGSSRLNTVGVWTTVPPGPLNQWIGFSYCTNLLVAKTYCIGIACDDFLLLKHNGNILVAATNNNSFNYNYWHVFEITLQPGLHLFTMEGQNAGGNASFGAEIYDAPSLTLQGYTTSLQVQGVTVFSTYNKKIASAPFQTGQSSGYSCPPGYAFNNCGAPACSLIETVPFVDCPGTYRVTACAGQGITETIVTSTDLSAYLVGTYKVCVSEEIWPDGCYCVTVQEIAYADAPAFSGVFQLPAADCCASCLQVCYLLTACTPGIDPVIVCNDLSAVDEQVIKIEGCGDICWTVSLAPNCDDGLLIPGTITEFNTCEECLPPVPPIPPPYDLHLRKIKPGWNSPNSCYTTATIEKINCSFGQQVYNQMLSKRFGITICCEDDLTTWDIKKQLLDYDLLTDPSMCKSTLCDCDPPCLIDVILTLLPFCADPIIIDAVIDIPCLPPVFVGAEIAFVIPEAPCYCYTVEYSSEGPTTIQYFDCCCVLQSQVIPAGQGTIPICGTTAPITYNDPIVVTNTGLCGVAPACVPPPPACSCWKIEYPLTIDGTMDPLSYDVAQLCPCPDPIVCTGQTETLFPGDIAYACSIAQPSIDLGLILTNTGNCGSYCGPIPRVCVCYQIDIINASAECKFSYIDCDGVQQTNVPMPFATNYICAFTPPVTPCPIPDPLDPPYIVYSTPWVCTNGVCGPPFPCVCTRVTINFAGLSYAYRDCNGVYQIVNNAPIGILFICGSNFVSASPEPFVIFTPFPGDCGLNECVCVCYSFEVTALPGTQDIIDCSGNQIQIGGIIGTIGVACVRSFVGPMNPNLNLMATPGACLGQC